MRVLAAIAAGALACLGYAPAARAAPAVVTDGPCAGCKAWLPASDEAVPLLVVLHGDSGHGPGELVQRWHAHLGDGAAILALRCPAELGCKGSWWQWNGDPAWLVAQVDALALRRAIDRRRVWLAGWSGGASYMGLRAPALQRSFAALVYHGGGIPPLEAGCASSQGAAPALFLVGSGNPLHRLAVRLREHHERCGDEVVWRLVPRADHPAEWESLDTHGAAIASWLRSKHRS